MHEEPWVLSRKHVLIASWEAALVEEEEKTELCEALGCSSGRHRALSSSLSAICISHISSCTILPV